MTHEPSAPPSDPPTDQRTVLLRGGEVHSPADPFATALLVDRGSVAWVGSEGAADVHADGVDEVVDLQGALVAPAFVDAHVHATATGLALTGLDLSGAATLAEALDLVERHARARRGGVVLGHGWDETRWPERRPPTRAELDRATYGGVAYLSRVDVHSCVVTSALVAAAPEVRAADGWDEQGPLTRDAHHVARRVAQGSVGESQRRAAQRATRARAAELGIGAFHELAGPDISSPEDLAGLLALAREEPGPQVLGYWGELGGVERARELSALGAAGDLFADGALGSRTASLRADYADAEHAGHAYLSAAQVRDHVVACTRAGLQAGFHAIGDAALDVVLAGLREAAAEVGLPALRTARHRIEHAEMLDAAAVAALAELGAVASVQPVFDALWGGAEGMYAERLGAERALGLNPYADLAAAGVPLALGSDAPVTPLGPWEAVRAAAFHHVPAQRLSVRSAFTAHTRGGWRAAGRDDAGVLVPGAPATYAVWEAGELVVQAPDDRVAAWSTDPRSGTPGLPDLTPGTPAPRCLRTVVDGRVVHDVEGALT
ncbi:amidohydrolase [Vallicoccus soli]|uniref:Amidohydrolase n=1 Tax=Vallicoccus soli TaxID=2339232 RepID=A0A3A3YR30_9ACTN|nr:amidohydrolase family protein [Vallicoccus soli]RJK93165.1 amidohydrolase [Vallicoccus soli]